MTVYTVQVADGPEDLSDWGHANGFGNTTGVPPIGGLRGTGSLTTDSDGNGLVLYGVGTHDSKALGEDVWQYTAEPLAIPSTEQIDSVVLTVHACVEEHDGSWISPNVGNTWPAVTYADYTVRTYQQWLDASLPDALSVKGPYVYDAAEYLDGAFPLGYVQPSVNEAHYFTPTSLDVNDTFELEMFFSAFQLAAGAGLLFQAQSSSGNNQARVKFFIDRAYLTVTTSDIPEVPEEPVPDEDPLTFLSVTPSLNGNIDRLDRQFA